MKSIVFKTSRIIFGILIGVIFLLILFFQKCEYSCKTTFIMSNIELFCCILFIGLLIKIKNTVFSHSNVKIKKPFDFNRAANISTIILFLCQFYISYNILFETGWDSGMITAAAKAAADGELSSVTNYYPFSVYPNNLFLLFIETALFKWNNAFGIFTGSHQLMCIVIINCMLNSLACLLVYKTADFFVSKNFAFMGFLCAVALYGLSPWLVICYSDSFGLIFPILSFYLFVKPSEKNWAKWANKICSIIIGCIGYFIKPQCIIILIALVVIELFYEFRLKNKKGIIHIGVIIACILLSVTALQKGIGMVCEKKNIALHPEDQFGMTHFLMMGLNPESGGSYSANDALYSASFETKAERIKGNLEKSAERLKGMGIWGYAKFLSKKVLTIFNDGTYAWGVEGDFYSTIYDKPNTQAAYFLREVYYNDGKYFNYFALFEQFIWVAVLFLSFLSVFIKSDHKNKKEFNELVLAIIGLIFFELLFEARARYLYTYTPIFCLLVVFGIERVHLFIQKKFPVSLRKKLPPP